MPGGRLPDAYRRDGEEGVVVVPERAAVVRDLFALRRHGLTLRAVAVAPDWAGCTTARGHVWHASSVREILLNEAAYRGGRRGESAVRWTPILAA